MTILHMIYCDINQLKALMIYPLPPTNAALGLVVVDSVSKQSYKPLQSFQTTLNLLKSWFQLVFTIAGEWVNKYKIIFKNIINKNFKMEIL